MLNVNNELKIASENLKLVLFDLFGTLICHKDEKNNEVVLELIKDLSSFIKRLNKLGIQVGIISGTLDDVINTEFSKIKNCELSFSSLDKLSVGEKLIEKYGISFDEVLFVGDELFDLPLLRKVGVSIATQDARREVKRGVKFVIPVDCGSGVLEYFNEIIFPINKDEQNSLGKIFSSIFKKEE